jgi:hypothetical protein
MTVPRRPLKFANVSTVEDGSVSSGVDGSVRERTPSYS